MVLNMVQVLKEEVRERIYSAAVEEFYENNYNSAKMKDIARRANIPTGLIYSYYKNKEDLFAGIARPVFQKLKEFIKGKKDRDQGGERIFDVFEEIEIDFIMNLFQERKQLIILVDKSEGTEFEGAKEEIVNLLEIHIREGLAGKIKGIEDDYKDFFYHILADNFTGRMFEIFRHFEDLNKARKMIELIARQHFYGVYDFVK
ncbi:TetR family transcriptional regulator [Iocasia frigidifontis]|uniref:TetR family transcriptional regulator n=2 Tax=Halanaerobiaceae TaxID=972 RepID=A0A8A7KM11_9FIRM|nr:TetR/AcrR family transcriptional regulator [Halocella sp. SP3-1]QTL98872.1 TetR family transcriptional regulator [Iocasia fonsfrigidae]